MDIIESFSGTLHERYIICFNLILNAPFTIYKVRDSLTGNEYTAKVFNKYSNSIKEEVKMNEIISRDNNPSFVKCIDDSVGYLNLEDNVENKYYILFENPSKGNLLEYINCYELPGFSEKICKIIFFKILKCIQDLHKIGIYHGNKKAENIYFDGENFNLKIGDFSHSLLMNSKNGEKIFLKKRYGISDYTAPEVIKGKEFDGEKADVFSLGILLFILRTKKLPFKCSANQNISFSSQEKLYKLIMKGRIDLFWDILENSLGIKDFSPEFKSLFIKMVDINPKKRPTVEDIFKEEWIKKISFLNKEESKLDEQEMIQELKRRKK